MPLPVVAIVAEDTRLPFEAAPAIVASCARVSGEARCVRQADPLAPAASYLAVVSVTPEGKLHVALLSRADGSVQRERDLVFVSSSFGAEHWNSAGLVIAALVADAEPPPTVESPAPRPAAADISASAAPVRRGMWVRVDISGVATPGFDFDPWRLGAELKLAFGSPSFPLYPAVAVRWLTANGRVQSQALSVAAGAGIRLIHLSEDKVALRLELAAVSGTLLVSATTSNGTEQSFRTRYGARLGLTSSFRLAPPLHAFLGAETSWFGHRAALELDGQRVGAEPRYVPGFTLGLSLTF